MATEQFPRLAGQGMISVDVETCDPDLKDRGPGWHRDDGFIAGVAVGTEAGLRRYYPIAHAEGENLDKTKVFGWLKAELADPKVPKSSPMRSTISASSAPPASRFAGRSTISSCRGVTVRTRGGHGEPAVNANGRHAIDRPQSGKESTN
jgi:hypothetical protein